MSEFEKFVEMLDGNVLMERHYRVQMEGKENRVILLRKPYKKKQALEICGATAQEVYDRWSAAFDELLPF